MAEGEPGSTMEQELELAGYDELDIWSEEERRVLLWRLDQFCSLGFGFSTSVVMADAHVDLGEARRLMAAGCPPDTASRILL